MLQKLIKYSLRSFRKQRLYVIINVLGLSVGITCSLFIAFLVINDVSYDRYNKKKERIFRLIQDVSTQGEEYIASYTPAVMGPAIQKEIPEIEDFLRMTRREPVEVSYNNQTFTERDLVEADSSFFNFFSIPLIMGDSKNTLNSPHKLVLSESAAKKIFENENPLDKIIKVGSDTIGYTVSGVMADIPENSHFNADMLSSFMTNPRSSEQIWTNNSFSTYLLLKENSNYVRVDEKISELINKYIGAELQKEMGITMKDWVARGNKYRYYLQKLSDIHLDPSIQQEFKAPGDPKYLRIIGSLAVIIIMIAAINFMNLATAQAAGRAKEVGIKKVAGSSRPILVLQFLIESFILSFISLVLALIILKVTLPYFNNLLKANLELSFFTNRFTIPFLILYTLAVGFLSGSYPAFILSAFNPYEVLKGNIKNSLKNRMIRQALVIFQFSVSIFLIVFTIIMYKQIKFMLNKDLGFNKEQIVVIDHAETLGIRITSFKEAVGNLPGVTGIAGSTEVPGLNNNSIRYKHEGGSDETLLMETNFVDPDYIETYGITLVSGRSLKETFATDRHSCLINESAFKSFGITDITNTRFIRNRNQGNTEFFQVVGVVKNFHFRSMHEQISPYMFCLKNDEVQDRYLSAKISPGNYSGTISEMKNLWKEFTGKDSLKYYFLDDGLKEMYVKEKQSMQQAVLFSILAIFIASLGLFGLTSYTVEQRTKEIGVRKAMGSSITGIYLQIMKEIFILVTISALIACPVIYYFSGKWLENFYYRIHSGFFTFVTGLSIVVGIAIITVSYRVIRAAMVNPAQSLKYE
jgi:putative ABC transport system permease protein